MALTKKDLIAKGWSPAYIEKSLKSGSLKGKLVPVPERPKTLRWEVTPEAYAEWRAGKDARSEFQATPREIESVQAYLKAAKPAEIAALRKSLGFDKA